MQQQQYRLFGIVLLSAAFHAAAGAEQTGECPLFRSLTVEQTAVYDVQPPRRPAVTAGDGLEVLAWVDRPDYTYASGEDVRVFVEANKDAYVTVLNVDPTGEHCVQCGSDNPPEIDDTTATEPEPEAVS